MVPEKYKKLRAALDSLNDLAMRRNAGLDIELKDVREAQAAREKISAEIAQLQARRQIKDHDRLEILKRVEDILGGSGSSATILESLKRRVEKYLEKDFL